MLEKHEQHAQCPNCESETSFHFAGEQRCPPKVAELTGLPEVMQLWTCNDCHSTVMEPSLTFAGE